MEAIIELINRQTREYAEELDRTIMRAVTDVGVQVDKERLLRALTDARQFWQDGYNAALREQDTLKRLVMGEWVDCEAVQDALGIDFATGMKMFDFSRTAAWNPAPLNGQKIETKFRLKQSDAEEVVRCKDCIHWSVDCGTAETVCLKIYSDGAASAYAWQERKPDDFCSYGERREIR